MAVHNRYERDVGGGQFFGWVESTFTVADLTTASATEAESIANFPADAYPLRADIIIGEYFTGGAATAVTAQIGDTGDPNGLVAAVNVFDTSTVGSSLQNAGELTDGVEAEYGSTGPSLEAAYAPEVLFTVTTDTADDLTAGQLTARVYYKRYAMA